MSNGELLAKLDDFGFEVEDGCDEFNPEHQVGACSVDLRLSAQIWRLATPWRGRKGLGLLGGWRGRRRPLRLGRITLEELKPHRQWEPHRLRGAQVLQLHPREMILARTAERFHVPADHSALVQGRSSFARLGLSVHPSAGFINPGWSGHFPLPLMNESDAVLEIPVGTAICQVMFIPLTDEVQQDYAARSSKYQQDTGGPSYWWRDELFRELVDKYPTTLRDDMVRDLDESLPAFPTDLISALDRFLDHADTRDLGDAQQLLHSFYGREARLKAANYGLEVASVLLFGLFTTIWWGLDDKSTLGAVIVAALGAVALLAIPITHYFRRRYFTEQTIQDLRENVVAS